MNDTPINQFWEITFSANSWVLVTVLRSDPQSCPTRLQVTDSGDPHDGHNTESTIHERLENLTMVIIQKVPFTSGCVHPRYGGVRVVNPFAFLCSVLSCVFCLFCLSSSCVFMPPLSQDCTFLIASFDFLCFFQSDKLPVR